MRVHLINPSDVSFGVAVITPWWMYVLAAATPRGFGDPHLGASVASIRTSDGDLRWPNAATSTTASTIHTAASADFTCCDFMTRAYDGWRRPRCPVRHTARRRGGLDVHKETAGASRQGYSFRTFRSGI